MKIYSHIIFFITILFLASCTSSMLKTVTPIPEINSLEAKVYIKHCGTCHAVPHPKRISYIAWQNLLPVMDKRMTERGIPQLKTEDKKLILSYLKTHARQ